MLQEQAQVDPEFTNVVWQKLQEQNPSFFRAYNIQLQLQEQILAFNYLVRARCVSSSEVAANVRLMRCDVAARLR